MKGYQLANLNTGEVWESTETSPLFKILKQQEQQKGFTLRLTFLDVENELPLASRIELESITSNVEGITNILINENKTKHRLDVLEKEKEYWRKDANEWYKRFMKGGVKS